MSTEKKDSGGGCPYFETGMQSCGLFSEGFYMPLRSQVVNFCMTERYGQCPLFKGHHASRQGSTMPFEKDPAGGFDRRSHKRMPEDKHVVLRTCDEQGNATGEFSATAATVDFSLNGMRVVADRSLPPQTPLLYEFFGDFSIPFLQGMAIVRWQKNTGQDTATVEAGLVFYDSNSKSRLARELGG